MRGEFLAFIDGAQAPGGLVQITAGVLLVPSQSGSTVTSDPFNEAEQNWIWYTTFMLGYEEMVTDVIAVQGALFKRVEIDNKAMRRMRAGEELQFVVHNSTIGSAMSVNSRVAIRQLVSGA